MVRLVPRLPQQPVPPLHVAVLSDSGEPIIELRIDTVEFWTLESITVVRTPDSLLVGAPFPHVNQAMGRLKQYLPKAPAAHEYLDALQAYVVGPLDERELGCRKITFQLYGSPVSTRHSPGLATAEVQCLSADERPAPGGRWVPLAVLRPFVPFHMTDDDGDGMVRSLMAQGKHVPFLRPEFRRAHPPDVDRVAGKRKLPDGFKPASQLLGAGPGCANRPERSTIGAAPSEAGGCSGVDRHTPSVNYATPGSGITESSMAAAKGAGGGGKKREKWFDKKGNVVVVKRDGLTGMASYWPTCLVIVGKKHGKPLGSSSSPRYVVTEALPPAGPAPRDEWHISEVEPLTDAMPEVWKDYRDGKFEREGGEQRMRAAMVHAVKRQHEARQSFDPSKTDLAGTWDWLVPEAQGQWAEVYSPGLQ